MQALASESLYVTECDTAPYCEFEDDMALSENDKKWIKETISNAVKESRPRGLKKLAATLREYGPVGFSLATILSLVAIAGAAVYTATNRVTVQATFNQRTSDRLDSIETSLRTLQASTVPKKVIGELSQLAPKALGGSLSALRIVSQQPANHVDASSTEVGSLGRSLLEVRQDTPDYWPTLLQFVEFASSSVSPNAPPPGGPINTHFENVIGFSAQNHRTYELAEKIVNMRFEDSRILLTPGVVLRNVTFVNCVFQFTGGVDNAPADLKETGRMLLASGLQTGVISGV